MVTDDDHEHSEGETREEQAQKEILAGQESTHTAGVSEEKVQQPKKKRERKDPVVLVREAGKSLLPFARVQKIIKADKVCTTGASSINVILKEAGYTNGCQRCDIFDFNRC